MLNKDKTFIDKLAYIYLKDKKVLVTLSKGKDTWYIPGGKREGEETDREALIREVREELTVEMRPDTITYYETFAAQAHGKPEGVMVRMICYMAQFDGKLQVNSEIEKLDFFSYLQKSRTAAVDFLIFDDLWDKGLIE